MRERVAEQLKNLAAEFLRYQGNKSSIITVTNVLMAKDGSSATILFTVFPDEFEKTALEFAKRKRSDFREYVKEKSVIGRIPYLDFEIDLGEKNRQRIDELSDK